MTFLLRYWKIGALLALLAAAFAAGWYFSGLSGRLALETERKQVMADALAQVEAAQKLAYEAEQARDEARRKLAAYKPKVVERVRENPSGCTLPRPVTDGLRDQVRETNKAIVSAAGKPA